MMSFRLSAPKPSTGRGIMPVASVVLTTSMSIVRTLSRFSVMRFTSLPG